MSNEISKLLEQYSDLTLLDLNQLPPKSFLSWNLNKVSHQQAFFDQIQSVEAALQKLLVNYPNIKIVRGSSFDTPLGTKGDFFLGNLDASLKYCLYDTQQKKRQYPVIVTADLSDIFLLIKNKKISICHNQGDLNRLKYNGVINIQIDEASNNMAISVFNINKPPKLPFDKSKLADFSPTIYMKFKKLFG